MPSRMRIGTATPTDHDLVSIRLPTGPTARSGPGYSALDRIHLRFGKRVVDILNAKEWTSHDS